MKRLLVLLAIPVLLAGGDDKKKGPRAMAEVTLRVIEASSAANSANDGADFVPAELKTLLRFTRYRLMDSAYVRGVEDQSMRVALAGDLLGSVRFEVRAMQPVPLLEFEVQIDGVKGSDDRRRPRLLETTTTLKSGETVVLGASRMHGSSNALIVVLTGKLLP